MPGLKSKQKFLFIVEKRENVLLKVGVGWGGGGVDWGKEGVGVVDCCGWVGEPSLVWLAAATTAALAAAWAAAVLDPGLCMAGETRPEDEEGVEEAGVPATLSTLFTGNPDPGPILLFMLVPILCGGILLL